ncbi:MAG: hypothetical protein COB15_01355 [Flavobacteriales bacterium]|nr:MAG: hypothetical protein COB15_01355 [Flavobacteriales bacterium]
MKYYQKTSGIEWISGKAKGFSGKDLLKIKNVTIKIVKVDAFAEYPLHIHPEHIEFAYILEGTSQIHIGLEVHDGSKGDFFIFPEKTSHSILNPSEIECQLLIGSINI